MRSFNDSLSVKQITEITKKAAIKIASGYGYTFENKNKTENALLDIIFHANETNNPQTTTIFYILDQFERRLKHLAELRKLANLNISNLTYDDLINLAKLNIPKALLKIGERNIDNEDIANLTIEELRILALQIKQTSTIKLKPVTLNLILKITSTFDSALLNVIEAALGSIIVANKIVEDSTVFNSDFVKTLLNLDYKVSVKDLNKIEYIQLNAIDYNVSLKHDNKDESVRLAEIMKYMDPEDVLALEKEFKTVTISTPAFVQKGIFKSYDPVKYNKASALCFPQTSSSLDDIKHRPTKTGVMLFESNDRDKSRKKSIDDCDDFYLKRKKM